MSEEQTPPSFVRRTFASLHYRNFRLFFFGQIVSNSGNWLTMVALMLLVLDRTGSGVAVGLLSACQFGPILLLSAWGGVLVDRFNKRKLLYITQSLEMAQSFVLAGLAFMHDAPLVLFYLTAIVGGCLLAIDNPVRRSFVNEMVPPDDVPNAVTLYSAMVNISRIVGPADRRRARRERRLRMVLHDRRAVLLDGAHLALDDASVRAAPAARHAARPGQIRAGFRYILQRARPLDPVRDAAHHRDDQLQLLGRPAALRREGPAREQAAPTPTCTRRSAPAACSARCSSPVARRSSIRTVAMGAVGFGAAMLVLVGIAERGVRRCRRARGGRASVAYMTATTSIAQLRSSRDMIGRVLSIQTVLLIGTTPIGGPILGLLADSVGPRAPIFLGGIGALAAAAFGVLAARRVARDTADVEPGSEILATTSTSA